jgi:hypothetical protein
VHRACAQRTSFRGGWPRMPRRRGHTTSSSRKAHRLHRRDSVAFERRLSFACAQAPLCRPRQMRRRRESRTTRHLPPGAARARGDLRVVIAHIVDARTTSLWRITSHGNTPPSRLGSGRSCRVRNSQSPSRRDSCAGLVGSWDQGDHPWRTIAISSQTTSKKN